VVTTNGVQAAPNWSMSQVATGWHIEQATAPPLVWVPPTSPSTADAVPRTNPDLLVSLHRMSGLTWEQIARLFNVSRRSVHLWLTGGGMSAANEERLISLEAMVDGLPAMTPEARRHQLLQPDESGRSLFDKARYELSSNDHDINPSFEPSLAPVDDR